MTVASCLIEAVIKSWNVHEQYFNIILLQSVRLEPLQLIYWHWFSRFKNLFCQSPRLGPTKTNFQKIYYWISDDEKIRPVQDSRRTSLLFFRLFIMDRELRFLSYITRQTIPAGFSNNPDACFSGMLDFYRTPLKSITGFS